MPRRVFVTGAGIITAIGSGTDQTLDSFYHLRTGIGRLSLFHSVHNDIPVAEVQLYGEALSGLAGIDPVKGLYSRNALLVLAAARQTLDSSGGPGMVDDSTGLILATTVGGMDLNERYYQSLMLEDTYSKYVEVFDSADCAEKVASMLGISRFITTVSTACSSSANAIMLGARLIRSKRLDKVLAGGTDALTRFTLNGFLALEILSPTGCRPFDRDRNGLTIGEGAALLMLESEDTADPDHIMCEVTGYANVNEAYHQTASSPEGTGAFMAMQQAIETASLSPADISYINAHGTGTEINDLAEGRAIERLFSGKIPPVSSTKAFTGHTLGAAGAVEAVFSTLAIRHQILLPGLNHDLPMTELTFETVRRISDAEINHVISNSFGFGGNNTSLVFSKV